jgi:hypothetical protein
VALAPRCHRSGIGLFVRANKSVSLPSRYHALKDTAEFAALTDLGTQLTALAPAPGAQPAAAKESRSKRQLKRKLHEEIDSLLPSGAASSSALVRVHSHQEALQIAGADDELAAFSQLRRAENAQVNATRDAAADYSEGQALLDALSAVKNTAGVSLDVREWRRLPAQRAIALEPATPGGSLLSDVSKEDIGDLAKSWAKRCIGINFVTAKATPKPKAASLALTGAAAFKAKAKGKLAPKAKAKAKAAVRKKPRLCWQHRVCLCKGRGKFIYKSFIRLRKWVNACMKQSTSSYDLFYRSGAVLRFDVYDIPLSIAEAAETGASASSAAPAPSSALALSDALLVEAQAPLRTEYAHVSLLYLRPWVPTLLRMQEHTQRQLLSVMPCCCTDCCYACYVLVRPGC